jgi:hypothetical protein
MTPLRQAIREYLALRRSVGYRLDYAATSLVLQRIFYRRSRSNASRFFRCERYAM